MSWRIRGSYFESCNCDPICPCRTIDGVRGGRSTNGICMGVLSWLIEDGAADGTDLSGLPVALAVRVTDNGPCFKSVRFAAYIERRPELIHIRTRRKTPQQNGVRERAFGSLKYEHLYRLEIDDGHQLGQEVESYRQLFNRIRPHEALAMRRPLDVHLEAIDGRQTAKSNRARNPANSVKRDIVLLDHEQPTVGEGVEI